MKTLVVTGLYELNISEIKIDTLIFSCSRKSEISKNIVWENLTDLIKWCDWSEYYIPLISGNLDSDKLYNGRNFNYKMRLNFPFGTININETILIW